ncbi:MAG: ATP-binding protein [bacterium]|nr:ATP-binding protein [bacterium]
MNLAANADLLTLGLTAAAIGILGFVVFFNDTRSVTNRAFLIFTLVAILWGIANFAAYQVVSPVQSLWLWRGVIFTAVWFCFSVFTLALVFPAKEYQFPAWYRNAAWPMTALVSLSTLTSLAFTRLREVPRPGIVPAIENGPLLPIFGITVAFLIIGAIFIFTKKARTKDIGMRRAVHLIMLGTAITFALLIIFNFALPTGYGVYAFIPFGAIFILPFIACTAYAITRYHLFNARLIAAEIFSFFLSIATLLQIVFSSSIFELVFRISAFVLVLAVSILLVKSVIREVRLREEVQRLSEQKSEFMSFASHEIRNPITVMRGYASLILDGSGGEVSEAVKTMARKILIESTTVLDLISQYLNKSKIELGQLKYESEPFDLAALVDSAIDSYIPHAQENGLALHKEIDLEHPLTVVGDKGKIKEVIGNLIDNAIKYTKEGHVTVAVERHGVAVRVIVSDTGAGIRHKTMQNLFKKFGRADAQKMNLLGTGLGLYLAKTFIETQGGRVWAESEGEGKGSRFVVELPAAPAPQNPE